MPRRPIPDGDQALPRCGEVAEQTSEALAESGLTCEQLASAPVRSYAELMERHATYADVMAAHKTYADLLGDEPEVT